jgi:hypothetical protein
LSGEVFLLRSSSASVVPELTVELSAPLQTICARSNDGAATAASVAAEASEDRARKRLVGRREEKA